MRIHSFASQNFLPFKDGAITFPCEKQEKNQAEVQILTGENGSGKTRLLCALAAALGNPADLNLRAERTPESDFMVQLSSGQDLFLSYWSNGQALLRVNKNTPISPLSGFTSQNSLRQTGVFWEAVSRPGTNLSFSAQAYRGTSRVADVKIEAMKPVAVGPKDSFLTFDRPSHDDQIISQGMANLKMQSAMEFQGGVKQEEARASKIVKRFEQSIREITGRPFTFLVKPQPELHLVARWGGTEMKLNSLPDGLRSIIAWLISCISKMDFSNPDHPDPMDLPLILLLDEPESHLHPAWQRKLIPAAQRVFPNAQIIVATHSPFVISSVNSGWIHILRFDSESRVEAKAAIPCSRGDTYIDAVEEVLGLTEWYDPETEYLLARFREKRAEVLSARGGTSELHELAEQIAARSDSLKDMMARELLQLKKQLEREAATK